MEKRKKNNERGTIEEPVYGFWVDQNRGVVVGLLDISFHFGLRLMMPTRICGIGRTFYLTPSLSCTECYAAVSTLSTLGSQLVGSEY